MSEEYMRKLFSAGDQLAIIRRIIDIIKVFTEWLTITPV
jgi:hypothetical protein